MFAVNNGLLTLNGVPVSQLSDEQRRNAYGRVGNVNLGSQVYDFSTGSKPNANFDPRYFEAYDINRGDSDTVTGYRLRPEYQRLEGMVQVGIPNSVGGYGEVMNPDGIQYDEEFGYLTPVSNIKDPATPRDNLIGNLAMAAWAAPIAYGIAMDSGLLGAANNAGSAGFPVGAGPGTGPLLETAGVASGALDGAGATGALRLIPENLLQEIAVPPLDIANPALSSLPNVSSGGIGASLLSTLSNPANLGRLALGLSGLVGASNSRTSGGGNGDATSYDLQLPEGVQPFNPTGLLGNYTPRSVGLVPFMSSSSLLGGKNGF